MSLSYPFIIHASSGTVTKHFVVTDEVEEARAYLALLSAFRRYYPTPKGVLAQKADPQAGLRLDPSAAIYLEDEDGLRELPEHLQSMIRKMLDTHKSLLTRQQQELDETLAFAESVEHVLSLPVKEAVSLRHESGVRLVEYLVQWRSDREYEHVRRIAPDALPE